MNTQNKAAAMWQYVTVPRVASAYFAHEDNKGAGFPLFSINIHRKEDTVENLGLNASGTSEISAASIRAGSWLVVVDRPHGSPLALWAALGGPAVALMAIVGGLTMGLLRRRFHKPSDLAPQL